MIQRAAAELNIDLRQSWLIGDTTTDLQTARNAGIRCCGVTYGFQPESLADPAPDRLADRMEQVADWILNPNGAEK